MNRALATLIDACSSPLPLDDLRTRGVCLLIPLVGNKKKLPLITTCIRRPPSFFFLQSEYSSDFVHIFILSNQIRLVGEPKSTRYQSRSHRFWPAVQVDFCSNYLLSKIGLEFHVITHCDSLFRSGDYRFAQGWSFKIALLSSHRRLDIRAIISFQQIA
jgi:hypothetical protein